MNKKNDSLQKTQRINSPYPDLECEDPYERHYHNKGGVIIAYDSQGRIKEVKNAYDFKAYGDLKYAAVFEENSDGKRNS